MSIVLPNVNTAVFSGMEESIEQILYCRDASVGNAMAIPSLKELLQAGHNQATNIGLGVESVHNL
jgi:hypothetical protein